MARPDALLVHPRALGFTKMHGAGNDFVVLDLRDPDGDAARLLADAPAQVCRALADRHTGVGCDQVLTVEPPRSPGAAAAYRIWNADGSPSAQCGNGARCIAAWVARARAGDPGFDPARFTLDSPAGTHAVEALGDGGYRIAMGVPAFAPADVPLRGFDGAHDPYPVELDGEVVPVGAVSMGNPHAVVDVDDVDRAPVAALGAWLQAHAAFPAGCNVGFAQVVSRERIRLRVFERGAGETLACGSGACAAAAVLMRRGRVAREAVVSLPGGELRIAWPADDAPLLMSGPAAFVFEGSWSGAPIQ